MPTKFYLHDPTTTDTGTLPASGSTVSTALVPGTGTTVSLVNKSMDATIGLLQKSVAKATLANTADQSVPIVRFLSAPIAAQTIASQVIAVHWAGSVSNANSNLFGGWVLAVWRPGTGAVVGYPSDASQSSNPSFNGTTEVAGNSQVLASSSVTAQDGDLLVLELWRISTGQSMSTSYTNTFFYDGTVEDSAVTNAAYLLFANNVALSTGAQSVAEPIRVGASVAALSASIH